MPPEKSIWFRLGYALERGRTPPKAGRLAGLAERVQRARQRDRGKRGSRAAPAWPGADDLVASGAAALAAKLLDVWHPRGRSGPLRLLRAAASGTMAALVVELVRPVLGGRSSTGDSGAQLTERLVAGAGQGLIYGAVVEPRVPGSPLFKGALYGSTEYALDPMGGLGRVLGPGAPHRRLPVLDHLLESLGPHDRAYLEHVAFGIVMALLYGASDSSRGIRSEEGRDA